VFSGPTLVIGQAIDQVFSGESSAAIRNPQGTLRRMMRKTVRRLVLLGAAPAIILGLFGPWIFGVVFGTGWTEAGVYAQLLALPYLLQFAVNPVSGVLLYLERQGQMLAWSGVRLVLTAGGPVTCALVGLPITTAIAALSIGQVLSYAVLYFLCARAVSVADDEYRRRRRDL
jgi:O-antigen/teichoic acid export membrane protein